MANEVSTSVALTGSKNNATIGYNKSVNFTVAGSVLFSSYQTINYAAAEQLVLPGDITSPCALIVLANIDETKAILVSLEEPQAQKFAIIPAGKFMVLPPATNTIWCKTDDVAASASLQVMAIDA